MEWSLVRGRGFLGLSPGGLASRVSGNVLEACLSGVESSQGYGSPWSLPRGSSESGRGVEKMSAFIATPIIPEHGTYVHESSEFSGLYKV